VRLLLDTHVLLWWLADDSKLGPGIRSLIADGANDVFVSAISIAEIALKQSLGKLDAPGNLAELLAEEGFTPLPFDAAHASALAHLPWHHRDPFDRMLVAQAISANLTFATSDSRVAEYDVTLAEL
jgi:PIN domain nuclease of toxin-antitoxin system